MLILCCAPVYFDRREGYLPRRLYLRLRGFPQLDSSCTSGDRGRARRDALRSAGLALGTLTTAAR